jgi:hypothetical protein
MGTTPGIPSFCCSRPKDQQKEQGQAAGRMERAEGRKKKKDMLPDLSDQVHHRQ